MCRNPRVPIFVTAIVMLGQLLYKHLVNLLTFFLYVFLTGFFISLQRCPCHPVAQTPAAAHWTISTIFSPYAKPILYHIQSQFLLPIAATPLLPIVSRSRLSLMLSSVIHVWSSIHIFNLTGMSDSDNNSWCSKMAYWLNVIASTIRIKEMVYLLLHKRAASFSGSKVSGPAGHF
jgi:hypothetical protein